MLVEICTSTFEFSAQITLNLFNFTDINFLRVPKIFDFANISFEFRMRETWFDKLVNTRRDSGESYKFDWNVTMHILVFSQFTSKSFLKMSFFIKKSKSCFSRKSQNLVLAKSNMFEVLELADPSKFERLTSMN